MSNQPIPPRNEWNKLSVPQLYDLKSRLSDIYYNARRANASYANQYLNLINEADMEIAANEARAAAAKQEQEAQQAQYLNS